VVAEVTRTVRHIDSEVALSTADGLAKDCVVNCDVLLTVPKVRFLNQITTLSASKMADVERSLKFSLELT
jgi:mRNA interferase MazF